MRAISKAYAPPPNSHERKHNDPILLSLIIQTIILDMKNVKAISSIASIFLPIHRIVFRLNNGVARNSNIQKRLFDKNLGIMAYLLFKILIVDSGSRAAERTDVESDKRGYTIVVDGEAMTGDANYFCSVGRQCCRIGIRACHKVNKNI